MLLFIGIDTSSFLDRLLYFEITIFNENLTLIKQIRESVPYVLDLTPSYSIEFVFRSYTYIMQKTSYPFIRKIKTFYDKYLDDSEEMY